MVCEKFPVRIRHHCPSAIALLSQMTQACIGSNWNKTHKSEVKIKTGYTLNPCLVIAPNAARL
ncbi:hypothetical protein VCR12J2_1360287 [Vibrio coralliirubri]|nr:hypothetical protein VCR26J2_200054 [Vibrio coralliirubri]CDT86671.1 hypothetical protein VCR12J2_1360287 [Vibrio coralliirubri]